MEQALTLHWNNEGALQQNATIRVGKLLQLEQYELVRSQQNSSYWKNGYEEEQQKAFCCANMQLSKTSGKSGCVQHQTISYAKLDGNRVPHKELNLFLLWEKMWIESQISADPGAWNGERMNCAAQSKESSWSWSKPMVASAAAMHAAYKNLCRKNVYPNLFLDLFAADCRPEACKQKGHRMTFVKILMVTANLGSHILSYIAYMGELLVGPQQEILPI